MILYKGEILSNDNQSILIDNLYVDCLNTIKTKKKLEIEKVIKACDKLYHYVIKECLEEIMSLLKPMGISYQQFLDMAKMFSIEGLEYKCKIELGIDYKELTPLINGTKRKRYPLGILFHIAAGNVDILPAYSVIEGLLVGNINILKLPTGDSGLSIRLLKKLIEIEPNLKEYIYVFDVPSFDKDSLKKFAKIADGVVVWGGDKAIESAKQICDVTTKIIPWGHKLSFAYATKNTSDEQLIILAKHICNTNQVLCSSVQGIYLDCEDLNILEDFAKRFYEILKKVNIEVGKVDIGMRGKNTLQLYNDLLENKDAKILSSEGISVVIKENSELELSYMFRNVWIKRLSRNNIINTLKHHKNHLQSCALCCDDIEKEELVELLLKAGIVRITNSNPSRMILGEAHDGEYPLKLYSKIVEID